MSAEAARHWCETSESNYNLDIATFAKRVREYIEFKSSQTGKKHYVVFLCDEMGQYMGSDGNLLLNLQTVVENLGIECGGRAWVIATGQEDISSIIKETKGGRDAFSKIIGRFDTRLSLTSANVDEVIKKRLLAKTENGADKLRLLYREKNAVIKNLMTFSPDTPEKKLYANEDDFIDVYPFIPYQFKLLQEVFTGIRTHGASGKHLSEGERSLLNAFQEAAMQYSSFSDGTLIPFDAFYRTIETFLDHNISKVIIQAQDNSRLQDYDIQVLKLLFMVKYTSNFLPADLENLSTLMVENIDQDKLELKRRWTSPFAAWKAKSLSSRTAISLSSSPMRSRISTAKFVKSESTVARLSTRLATSCCMRFSAITANTAMATDTISLLTRLLMTVRAGSNVTK
jgi:hypothetical protein